MRVVAIPIVWPLAAGVCGDNENVSWWPLDAVCSVKTVSARFALHTLHSSWTRFLRKYVTDETEF